MKKFLGSFVNIFIYLGYSQGYHQVTPHFPKLSFSRAKPHSLQRSVFKRDSGISRIISSFSPTSRFLSNTRTDESTTNTNTNSKWASYGILISSFTDGIQKSTPAQEFLKYSLASVLTKHLQHQREGKLSESAIFSPCSGPDIDRLNAMEEVDDILFKSENDNILVSRSEKTDRMLNYLRNCTNDVMELRILYIPTAMYALRSDSLSSPGKQRQRARADGKKRRNQIVSMVETLIDSVNILAVTLDLDDSSIKQPYASLRTDEQDGTIVFPVDGLEALTNWKPHLIYLEGGNTFWLQHCIEKGSWAKHIKEIITSSETPAVYVGKSAGAILAGKWMETATWKGWDDPSIVPGMERFKDWKGYSGLNLVGGASFFPHMSEDWLALVEEKSSSLEELSKIDGESNNDFDDRSYLHCLHEWDVCCVEGSKKDLFIID